MSYVTGIEGMLSFTIHTLKNKWQFDILFPLFYQCLISIFSVQGPVEGGRNIVMNVFRKTNKRGVEMDIF